MRRASPPFAALFGLLLANTLTAAPPPNPLRFVSDKADLVIKIDQPRKLVEAVANLPDWEEAKKQRAVQAFLDAVSVRRFFEFVHYLERSRETAWPELLDKLAGGGIVLSSEIKNGVDSPVLVVVQATDEAALKEFVRDMEQLIEQELMVADSSEKLSRENHRNYEVVHVGKELHACRVGSALLLANKFEAIKNAVARHGDNAKHDGPARDISTAPHYVAAGKLLPPAPLLSLYYALDYLKNRPEAKELLSTPRENAVLTVLFASYLDVARRADFIAAGFYAQKDRLSLTVRLPAGRDGMSDDAELHLPREPKTSGTLPLLLPKGVIFSHSFYYDLGTLWTKRDKVLTGDNAQGLEKGVKEGSRFLLGTSIDKLLTQSGVHHRLVAVNSVKLDYKTEPQVKLPAFAYVGDMRDPAFGKSLQSLIRTGALLAATQVSLKLFEEKYGDAPIFGYRFSDDGKLPNDPQGLRFNFMPTFATASDQFVAASNPALCKELIDLVRQEDRSKPTTQNMRLRVDAKGGAQFLSGFADSLLTQTILDQAISEAEAKRQVALLVEFVRGLGALRIETDYLPKEFRLNIEWEKGE
jgi:hypothetical protein